MAEGPAVIYIVDDDPGVRQALSSLFLSVGLSAQPFESAREFLATRRREAPGCLVLDVQLPGLSGLDMQRELAERDIEIPIIFITGHADIPMTVQAMKGGAVEFLTKPFRDQDLLDAVQNAVDRDRITQRDKAELSELCSRLDSLTPREREIMQCVVSGRLNKQIAADLGHKRGYNQTPSWSRDAEDGRRFRGGSGSNGGKAGTSEQSQARRLSRRATRLVLGRAQSPVPRIPSALLGSGKYSTVGWRRTGCGYNAMRSRSSAGMSLRTGKPNSLAVSNVMG